ncbi:hypothetical protein EVAR_44639_1 [Eumeta japonica]|uniref:Uncharacterized protein n=1 Tax=Eumeta variegata TaxID=151549 RepID=A0A4C1ZQX8_EUMVA|nr:hypothetical protein EVAR_44639_1 [Eumeta japonica]
MHRKAKALCVKRAQLRMPKDPGSVLEGPDLVCSRTQSLSARAPLRIIYDFIQIYSEGKRAHEPTESSRALLPADIRNPRGQLERCDWPLCRRRLAGRQLYAFDCLSYSNNRVFGIGCPLSARSRLAGVWPDDIRASYVIRRRLHFEDYNTMSRFRTTTRDFDAEGNETLDIIAPLQSGAWRLQVLTHEQTLARERMLALQRTLARERALASDRTLAVERTLALRQTLAGRRRKADERGQARMQVLAHEQALARERMLALQRMLTRERALASNRALSLERTLALRRALALERALARESTLAQGWTQPPEQTRTVARRRYRCNLKTLVYFLIIVFTALFPPFAIVIIAIGFVIYVWDVYVES